MFESARIRLTAWYLLIIMSVSILFSLVIYNGINVELQRFEQIEEIAQEFESQGLVPPKQISRSRVDPEMISAARARLITTLGIINLVILAVSGFAGYFLAGRTLRPIQHMVDQLNRFVSDASHEMRTPLTSLRSEIEVSLLNKKLTLPQAKKLLQSNLEEVIQLQELSDNLLELTQYDNTNNAVLFAPVSTAEVLKEAVKKVHGQAKKKNITIEQTFKEVIVTGNKDRLRELFTILLDNAIKYSNSESTVKVTSKHEKKSVYISVSDQGIGIDKKELPYIFERFYRSDKSRSKKIDGFGLGLSIAKKIVTMHKGSISVKSVPQKGTTFIIRLPLHKST